MCVLEVANLQVQLGEREIIKNLSFKLEAGQSLSVLGPNGAGKTTLVRALTGILPYQGEVTYFSKDLKAYGRKEFAKRVAVVNQRQEITPGFRVKDAVALGRLPHIQRRETKRDYQVVEDAIAITELTRLKDSTLDTISGGELARVAIARALAQEPDLLILDEPTAHLDIGHTASLSELLLKIKKEKQLSLLLIVHDLSLAAFLSNRIILFGDEKFYYGDVDEVLKEEILKETYGVENLVTINPLNGQKAVFWNYKGK